MSRLAPGAPVASTAPYAAFGVPAGIRVNRDGTRNDFSVRWDMITTDIGLNGHTSVTRRFATADEATAAVQAGMGRAYRVTAFDAESQVIATRRNAGHHRNWKTA